MSTEPFRRAYITFVGLAFMASGLVAQQALMTPARSESSLDELLAEVRALRGDLQQASRVSLRAQLLVGRLQLQEHRMNAIAAQLTDVRRLISIKESGRSSLRQQLKELEEASRPASLTPEQQRETDGAMSRLTTLVAQMYHEEQEHRVHETELSAQLAMEQSRWVDFNSRLDELERLLPVAK